MNADRRRTEPRSAAAARRADDAALVQGRGHLPAARQGVLRLQRRRHRRLPRPDREARLHPGPRRQHDLAAAVLSVAAARRRLRHRRLSTTSTRSTARATTSARFVREAHRRGLRSSPSWSSTTPRTSIRGSRPRAARRRARPSATSTSGATTRRQVRRHAHHLHRHRDVELGLGPGRARQYYWHRFFSHQPDLNFDNPRVLEGGLHAPCASGSTWASTASGSTRSRTCRARRHQQREPARDARGDQEDPRARSTRTTADRLLLAEANMWPEDVREYFGDGDECHMAYHFPLMPRMYMAIAQEDRHPIVEIMQQTPDIPDALPVGDLPAQPRRAHARDGDQQGARLHVPHVRGRPARAHQPRHPPAPRAADGERPRPHQADEQPAAVDAGLADHLLRRRDRHGRQHLPRRPQRRAHADAVEPGPQRRLLARRPAAAVPAADHGPDLRLRGGQRRGAGARPVARCSTGCKRMLAVRKTQPGVRPRHASRSCSRATARCSPTCASTATRAILCVANLCALGAAGRARPGALQGPRAGRAARPHAVPADRRAAVPADAAGATASTGSAWPPTSQPPRWHEEQLPCRRPAGAGAVRRLDQLLPRARRAVAHRHGREDARAARDATCCRASSQPQRWYAGKGEAIDARAARRSRRCGTRRRRSWLLALVDVEGAQRAPRATSCRWRSPGRTRDEERLRAARRRSTIAQGAPAGERRRAGRRVRRRGVLPRAWSRRSAPARELPTARGHAALHADRAPSPSSPAADARDAAGRRARTRRAATPSSRSASGCSSRATAGCAAA